MPRAPWNGTVNTLRSTASERHISGCCTRSEIFIGRETEARRGAIYHGLPRVGETAAAPRHRDDHENLDDFLRRRDAEDCPQRQRELRTVTDCQQRHERRAGYPEQGNAGGAEQEGGPYLQRRDRAAHRRLSPATTAARRARWRPCR